GEIGVARVTEAQERAALSRPDQRRTGVGERDREVEMLAGQRGDGARRAFVRDPVDLDPKLLDGQQPDEMRRAAAARKPAGECLRPRRLDELVERLPGIGVDEEELVGAAPRVHRREVACAVARGLVQVLDDDALGERIRDQRVAVGLGSLELLERDLAAGPGLILDQHVDAEVLLHVGRDASRLGVLATAGVGGHDDLDRLPGEAARAVGFALRWGWRRTVRWGYGSWTRPERRALGSA